MTGSTTQPHTSAAPARAGTWAAALPRDGGLDRLLADTALSATAKMIAVALVRHWAWKRDVCWPCDATIAAAVGRSPGHVQRCLRQLQRAGWVEREHTDAVPNGRRIVLRWRREPGAGPGAQPPPAPARTAPPAPARSESVVPSKPRTEPSEESTAPTTTIKPRIPNLQDRPGVMPEAEAVRPSPPVWPRKPSQPPLRAGRLALLGRQDLAQVAQRTGDPILLAELFRLSAPPPPSEPDPWSEPAAELVRRLPGRHDLVMPTARALCVAVGDEKPATLRACTAMARAVAAREVPAETLGDCLRQATGPQARHRGKVLVVAWKRSGRASAG